MRCAILVAAVCAACNPTQVSGSLAVVGAHEGDWTFAPSYCTNGDTREFYGADLTDGDGAVRLYQDPVLGWLVTVTRHGDPGGGGTRIAPKAGCTRFVAALHVDPCGRCGKNDTDEDDSTISGSLDLDCAWPQSGRVVGQLAFKNCDNPEEDN